MANTTAKVANSWTKFDDSKTKIPLASTAATYYPAAFIGRNSSGYGTKFDDTAALRLEGIVADSVNVVVDSGGSNGDVTLYANAPRFITVAIAAAAAGDEGKPVFALFDQTGTYAPTGTYNNFLGWVHRVVDATHVELEMCYGRPPVVAVPIQYLAAAIDAPAFVADRPYTIISVIGRPVVAGTDASAVTAAVMKAPSGTAMASGTAVHASTINLKGTINTNQVMVMASAAAATLASGDAIGLDVTGTLTAAIGTVSVLMIAHK